MTVISLVEPITLVGEANPYSSEPRHALYDEPHGASGDRLRRLVLGLHRRTYLSPLFRRIDLCAGTTWRLRDARERARELSQDGGVIVLLGRKVAQAFHVDEPAFSVVDDRFVLLPHPSGLCRVWHEPGAFERARELLRSVRPDVPWGEIAGEPRRSPALATQPYRWVGPDESGYMRLYYKNAECWRSQVHVDDHEGRERVLREHGATLQEPL